MKLDIQKDEFVTTLKEQIDEGSVGLISEILRGPSSGGNEYAGYIGGRYFELKRRSSSNIIDRIAVDEGTYRQEENILVIETEINGFKGIVKPMLLFLLLFYPIVIVAFFSNDNIEGVNTISNSPFFLAQGVLGFGVLFFIMRTSISRLKYKLERDLATKFRM